MRAMGSGENIGSKLSTHKITRAKISNPQKNKRQNIETTKYLGENIKPRYITKVKNSEMLENSGTEFQCKLC